jgi:hypothetical protein
VYCENDLYALAYVPHVYKRVHLALHITTARHAGWYALSREKLSLMQQLSFISLEGLINSGFVLKDLAFIPHMHE